MVLTFTLLSNYHHHLPVELFIFPDWNCVSIPQPPFPSFALATNLYSLLFLYEFDYARDLIYEESYSIFPIVTGLMSISMMSLRFINVVAHGRIFFLFSG